MEIQKTKIIYSKILANHLVNLGFRLIRTEINIKDISKRVFVFEYSDELQAVVDEYIKNKNK